MKYQLPKFDLKLKYRKALELALIISLVLCTGVFLASKEFRFEPSIHGVENVVLKVEDVVVTRQLTTPPRPPTPTILLPDVETPLEHNIHLPDAFTYPEPENIPRPPVAEVEPPPVEFYQVENQPELIGGTQAILDYIIKNDLYPEMARIAETGGEVLVYFTVTRDGNVIDEEVAQEKPVGFGFGDVAVKAILAMKFKPGKQRDKPVAVRMQQTIKFRIK
jgi:protein TonB